MRLLYFQKAYRELRDARTNSTSITPCLNEVTEQIIGVTHLSPLPVHSNHISPDSSSIPRSAGHDSQGHFLFPDTPGGVVSPGNVSPSENSASHYHPEPGRNIKSQSFHEGDGSRTSDNLRSVNLNHNSREHNHVQSSFSVPNFREDDDRLKVPSSNDSSANSDSSLPDIINDNQKSKLSQRRTSRSGHGRYITADAIQDINKLEDKDNSIYKRLSWNYGTKDNTDERQGVLKAKTQSSDSLRSIHSSSGVSSTGSLHLSPEEMEYSHGDISTIHESGYNDMNEDDFTSEERVNDITQLFKSMSTSAQQDGIVSVDINKYNDKKLSHSQLMQMKKRLLLSSSVEAR